MTILPQPVDDRCPIYGVTYKPDVADLRESPALEIVRLLEARGAQVSFHDPLVTSLREEGLDTLAVALTPDTLATADCVVIATNHSSYDWDRIRQQARLVVDTRYALGAGVIKKAWPVLEENVGMLER